MKNEKKPIKFGMIYDTNSEFIKRLQNTVYVIYCLLQLAFYVGCLIALPFTFYAIIKAAMYYVTYIV